MDAVAGGRPLSAREEELLGLLACFPDGEYGSDRELSFSDLVEAGASRPSGADPAPREGPRGSAAPSSSPGRQEAASKQQRKQALVRERRQRSGCSRGSCGGCGDGVLLNFYVPGLLTRSMTAPRPPGRGALPPPGTGQAAPAKAASPAAGKKARKEAPLGIGCWPALWGRSRDRRRPAKACS